MQRGVNFTSSVYTACSNSCSHKLQLLKSQTIKKSWFLFGPLVTWTFRLMTKNYIATQKCHTSSMYNSCTNKYVNFVQKLGLFWYNGEADIRTNEKILCRVWNLYTACPNSCTRKLYFDLTTPLPAILDPFPHDGFPSSSTSI